ncbi:diguanylate cyclase [Candidatus Margulisiibacteriota bacterium]
MQYKILAFDINTYDEYISVSSIKDIVEEIDGVKRVFLHRFYHTGKTKKSPIITQQVEAYSKDKKDKEEDLKSKGPPSPKHDGDPMHKTQLEQIVPGVKGTNLNHKIRIGRWILSVEFEGDPSLQAKQAVFSKFVDIKQKEFKHFAHMIGGYSFSHTQSTINLKEVVKEFIELGKQYLDLQEGQINFIFSEDLGTPLHSQTIKFKLDTQADTMNIEYLDLKSLPKKAKHNIELTVVDKEGKKPIKQKKEMPTDSIRVDLPITEQISAEMFFESKSHNNFTKNGPNCFDDFYTIFNTILQKTFEKMIANKELHWERFVKKQQANMVNKDIAFVLNHSAMLLNRMFGYKKMQLYFMDQDISRFIKKSFDPEQALSFAINDRPYSKAELHAGNFLQEKLTMGEESGSLDILLYIAPKNDLSPRHAEMLKDILKIINSNVKNCVMSVLGKYDLDTGLYNRRFIRAKILEYYLHYKTTGEKAGLIFVDMDNLKFWNDMVSHGFGDQLLAHIGKLFLAQLNKINSICQKGNCLAARYGGDEFIILGHLNEEQVTKATENLLAEIINNPISVNLDIAKKDVIDDGKFHINLIGMLDKLMNPERSTDKEQRGKKTKKQETKEVLTKRQKMFRNYLGILKKQEDTKSMKKLKEKLSKYLDREIETDDHRELIMLMDELFQNSSKHRSQQANIKEEVLQEIKDYILATLEDVNIFDTKNKHLNAAMDKFLELQFDNITTSELREKLIDHVGKKSIKQKVDISASFGAACSSEEDFHSPENFLSTADSRQQEAKENGKKCIVTVGDRLIQP